VGLQRADGVSWILIRNERHLQRVLSVYLAHYNTARPHRGLNLEMPARAPDGERASMRDLDGPIERTDVLGHEYHRAA
jgi:putative transposase